MNRMTYKEQASVPSLASPRPDLPRAAPPLIPHSATATDSKHLAGQISLLKMFCTRCANEIADDAVQIFGGRALTKTGMGKFIEMFSRCAVPTLPLG